MIIEIGKAYKKFACGCIMYASVATFRKHSPDEKTPSGNFRKAGVCPICKTLDAGYQYRFKICPICRELRWTRRGNLTDGRCKYCGQAAFLAGRATQKKPKPKKRALFFQHGQLIPEPKRLHQETMCAHRRHCLPYEGRLHCGGCAYFESESVP